MKIKNTTQDVRTTWTGTEIQPGQTLELDLPADEAAWLLRHGCVEPEAETKAKPAPRRSTRRNYAE